MTSEAKQHSQGRSDTLDNIDPTVNKETGKLSHYAAYLHSPAWLVLTSDALPTSHDSIGQLSSLREKPFY